MSPITMSWQAVLDSLGVPALARHTEAPLRQAIRTLHTQGRWADAETLCRELVRRQPEGREVRELLAFFLRVQGKEAEAAACVREIVALEVKAYDLGEEAARATNAFKLAAAGLDPTPTQAPADYVRQLYDRYAGEFDDHLVGTLQYQTPVHLLAAVDRALGESRPLDILDIGCGTGLAGVRFRPRARILHGVDLSEAMLELARQRGVYDGLERGELTQVLSSRPASFDLIIACDVFIHLGDLAPIFTAAARCLRPGGILAFSAVAATEPGYHLLPNGHFTHHPDYVREQAAAAGFAGAEVSEAVLRQEGGKPVTGFIAVVTLPAARS